MADVLLLADIGGTHVRFSVYDGQTTFVYARYLIREFMSFEQAIQAYAERHNLTFCGMIIGAAGVRQNDVVRLTNCPWIIDTAALKSVFQIKQVVLVNDFSLQGLGVLQCKADDFQVIGGGEAHLTAPRTVIGCGTGLGVCFLVPDLNGGYQVLESEGGHASVAGVTPAMRAVIQKAYEKLPHVSYERFASGTGLLSLYQIVGENYTQWAQDILSDEIVRMQRVWHFIELAPNSDTWQPVTRPPEITALAELGNEIALMTFWLFFKFLGVFCSDMALTIKATGGVYLVGDLLNHPFVSRLLMDSDLRRAFETKGRFKGYVQQIPIQLVKKKDIPLCGLTRIAQSEWNK